MRRYLLLGLSVILLGILVFVGCAAPATPPSTPTPAPAPVAKPSPAATSAPVPTPAAAPTTAPSPGAAQKTFNLKFAHEHTPGSYFQLYGHIPFAQSIEKATNGRIKVIIYDSSTLMKGQQIVEGTKSGIADIGLLNLGYFPGQFEYSEGISVPFLFSTGAAGSKANWAIFNKYPQIQSQFAGLKVLAAFTCNPYFLLGRTKFYKTMDDFKGQKMRAAGGGPTELIKRLGGTPMLIPMPDCYLSLQKGVIDGMLSAAEPHMGFRMYEVASYITYAPTIVLPFTVVMNLDTWNSFPKDIQNAIAGIGEQSSILYGKLFDKSQDDMAGVVKKSGYTLNEYTLPQDELQKWIDTAGKPVRADWVKNMQTKGLTNAQQIQDDIIALSKEYSK